MQGYRMYPPLQVLVVFGRYPNKFFFYGHVSSTYVRMMDLGLGLGLGRTGIRPRRSSGNLLLWAYQIGQTQLNFFLILGMYPQTSSLPTPRPFKREAGVIARMNPRMTVGRE